MDALEQFITLGNRCAVVWIINTKAFLPVAVHTQILTFNGFPFFVNFPNQLTHNVRLLILFTAIDRLLQCAFQQFFPNSNSNHLSCTSALSA